MQRKSFPTRCFIKVRRAKPPSCGTGNSPKTENSFWRVKIHPVGHHPTMAERLSERTYGGKNGVEFFRFLKNMPLRRNLYAFTVQYDTDYPAISMLLHCKSIEIAAPLCIKTTATRTKIHQIKETLTFQADCAHSREYSKSLFEHGLAKMLFVVHPRFFLSFFYVLKHTNLC